MRKITAAIAFIAAILVSNADAQTQFPQTLPANTVWGRLGIGAGPGQAIPFSILSANVFLGLPAHGVVVAEGSGTPPVAVTPGAAGLPLISNGASADPSYQPLTNSGTNFGVAGSPLYGAQGSFWTDVTDADGTTNARLHLFRDRLFVDDGVLITGANNGGVLGTGGIVANSRSGTAINSVKWDWAANGASIGAISSWGAQAIVGYSVLSSQNRTGRPIAGATTIGVSGFGLNDLGTVAGLSPTDSWGGYFETLRKVSGAGSATAIETDTGTVSTVDADPYNGPGPAAGASVGINPQCGGSAVGVTYANCSYGIGLSNNGAKWRKGIVIFNSGLDTTQGLGGGGIGMSMPNGVDLQWLYAAGSVGTTITAQNNSAPTASLLQFINGGVQFTNGGAQFQPQWTLINTHAGNDNAYFVTQKQHGVGAAIQANDSIGTFLVQGFANAAYQSSGSLSWIAGTPSGSNVPSTVHIQTSTSGGQLNNTWAFDLNAHVDVTSSATAPTAGTCTGFSLQTGSTDYAGGTAVSNTVTSCSINFGSSYAAAPHCVVTLGGSNQAYSATTTTSALSVTWAAAGPTSLHWICPGS